LSAHRRSFPVEFDNSFEVPLPPGEAWPLLMDIRKIAPCMPGAAAALGVAALRLHAR
jgi:hypothetical protein